MQHDCTKVDSRLYKTLRTLKEAKRFKRIVRLCNRVGLPHPFEVMDGAPRNVDPVDYLEQSIRQAAERNPPNHFPDPFEHDLDGLVHRS